MYISVYECLSVCVMRNTVRHNVQCTLYIVQCGEQCSVSHCTLYTVYIHVSIMHDVHYYVARCGCCFRISRNRELVIKMQYFNRYYI